MIPILFCLLFYDNIKKINNKKIDIIINLSYINMLFMFLALKHAYYARICIYFDVYYLLLIPLIIDIFDKKMNRIMYYFICVSYFSFSTILLINGEANILPYKWSWNLF